MHKCKCSCKGASVGVSVNFFLFGQATIKKRNAVSTNKAREGLEKRAEQLGQRRRLSLNNSDAPPRVAVTEAPPADAAGGPPAAAADVADED